MPHPDSVLVTVQRGGTERPFFFVAAAYRDVFAAAHLARALGPAWPLYALQPPADRARGVVLPRMADLVACYVERLRSVQPHGPYRLGGYSSGAILAIEVARSLTDDGGCVETLALLEGGPGVPNDLTYGLVRALRRLARGWRLSPRPGEPRPLRLLRSFLTDDGMFATYTVLRNHRIAPYTGSPAILFAAESRGATALRIPTKGWDALLPRGLVVEPVPGDHDSCMQPPHVAKLGERLRDHMQANAASTARSA
jgi:thioesterase domain-containing protein